jgi:glutathione S-transferase
MKLYDFELSGNCYKVRLLLNILGLAYDRITVDFYPGREHKSDAFLNLNPLGQIPVLDDEGLILRDAQAILAYLARKYDPTQLWFPQSDPALMGQILMWLAFANEISTSSGAARLGDAYFYPVDIEQARKDANQLFRILDEHLWFSEIEHDGWICPTPHPTIADLACFPYVILSEEGGISRLPYPAIRRWTDRVKLIPGFSLMAGVYHTVQPANQAE